MNKVLTNLLSRARNSFEYRTGFNLSLSDDMQKPTFPTDTDELITSSLYRAWWYYTVELLPGMIAKGVYPDSLPLLPRILMKNCELAGMECLDVGTMEGLIPILMRRRGASRVVAVDAIDHCADKMAAVKFYHGADFEFRPVGLLYELYDKFPGQGFDLINVSGLLYHVFSPLMVLAGVRPLLKRNGLIIISTNVIFQEGFVQEFNNGGRIQEETNTFWYLTVPLFDYLLRYMQLQPIDCRYMRHEQLRVTNTRLTFDKPSGYLSVVCRAVDKVVSTKEDKWMRNSAENSWEHRELPHWEIYRRQPVSQITFSGNTEHKFSRKDTQSVDLWAAVNELPPVTAAASSGDSHILKLADRF